MGMRTKRSKEFKARVALAALKGDKTMAELSSEFGVHAAMITRWRNEAREGLAEVFGKDDRKEVKEYKTKIEELYKTIGRIQVENDWMRKNLPV
jgi:transposase-like protein